MTNIDKGTHDQPRTGRQEADEQSLELLFRLASSRPEPPEADVRQVRDAVHGEWQAVTGARRWRRRAVVLAAAAGVVLTISMVLVNQRPEPTVPELDIMARVERISGQVQVFAQASGGDGAALAAQMPVYVGQTLRTGGDSGISLRLNGGISLRLDQQTVVVLDDGEGIELRSGRVYVDTQSPGSAAPDPGRELLIHTDLGVISHLGTQYMVLRSGDWLRVGVRQGGVRIDDAGEGDTASVIVPTGQELSLDHAGEQVLAPLNAYGPEWLWAEKLAPEFDLDGRTMAEFLDWVASETGLDVAYQSDSVRSLAEQTMLHGQVDLPATEALQLVLMTSDFSAEIRDGVIEVNTKS